MRNALPPKSPLKWNNLRKEDKKFIVPYTITGSYSSEEINVIYDAMKSIDRNTCIRFRPRSSEAEEDYVDIQNGLGEGGTGSICPSRCMKYDVVIHELLHVLGLWHEHMREDRDQYVKVHNENIKDGYQNQFGKILPSDAYTYGVPYDYLSIMHYEKNAFAKPGTITLETLDGKYQDLIGKQKEPSKNDYKKICHIYECSTCYGEMTDYETSETTPESTTTTTSPSVTRTTPLPPFTAECKDKDTSCAGLLSESRLNCSAAYYSDLCCASCKLLIEAIAFNRRTTQQPDTRPVSRESHPSPPADFSTADSIYRCEDKEPVRCKELAENHLLKCLTEIADVNLCCRTCNRILDYLVRIRHFV
ncbi:hypothetical protein RB195_004675 [Necator americanus]|uniref:Metalloendopeptidase n=1 Tax=Necator americanus TaxID=51031 RepID=A0ABR1BKT4_NECAM